MDKKSCIAFVIVVAILIADVTCSRNDPFQGQFLSNNEVDFSKSHLINATNTADYDMHAGWWFSGECTTRNLILSQMQTTPLPSGIPTYTVQVLNVCNAEGPNCAIYDIHLSCGWFSTARLINPNVFRRIAYNDCLLKNGNPTHPGESITFQYANTYAYPMSVSSIKCS